MNRQRKECKGLWTGEYSEAKRFDDDSYIGKRKSDNGKMEMHWLWTRKEKCLQKWKREGSFPYDGFCAIYSLLKGILSRTLCRRGIIVLLKGVVRDLIYSALSSHLLWLELRNRHRRDESSDAQCYFVEKPGLRLTEFLVQWVLLIILLYGLEEN